MALPPVLPPNLLASSEAEPRTFAFALVVPSKSMAAVSITVIGIANKAEFARGNLIGRKDLPFMRTKSRITFTSLFSINRERTSLKPGCLAIVGKAPIGVRFTRKDHP